MTGLFRKKGTKKFAAGAIAVFVVLVMLFAAAYPVIEADHDCCGHGCHVCRCIRSCAAAMKLFAITAASIAVFMSVTRSEVCLFIRECLKLHVSTPVTLKVRLNN